jgi:hypothetical protein
MIAAIAVAVILALHIIFVLLGANTGNEIVSTDADWAGNLAAWFKDMFNPSNAKLAVTLNYGLAAIVFLIAGELLSSAVRRL